MVATTTSTSEGWSSRSAFILAAVGAAVGLGNIWRFPTLAGESGGGAFVIFYIACVFLLGLPLVLSEVFIGKAGQTDAVGSIRRVAAQSKASPSWAIFGGVGALAAFLIVSFYSVVAGWVLYYAGIMGGDLVQAILAGDPFRGALAGESQDQIQQRLSDMFASPGLLLGVHFVFMGLTLGCARCHEHKFDPISQRDFYQLFAYGHRYLPPGSHLFRVYPKTERFQAPLPVFDLEGYWLHVVPFCLERDVLVLPDGALIEEFVTDPHRAGLERTEREGVVP